MIRRYVRTIIDRAIPSGLYVSSSPNFFLPLSIRLQYCPCDPLFPVSVRSCPCSSTMPIISRWSVAIPEVSLQNWVFGSSVEPLREKRCFTDANRPDTQYLTFSAFRLWAKRVAVGLQKAGLQPGDRVLLFSGNNIFFPVVFMGILMAGGIFTGANPTFVARELAYQLKDSDAKFLIAAEGSLDVALDAISQIGMSKDRVFIFDDAAFEGTGKSRHGIRNWNTLFGSVDEANGFVWHDVKNPKDTICCLNYSSGTTGVPKGVMVTHYNYVANGELIIYLAKLRPDNEKRLKTDKWLCMLPMYHAYGKRWTIPLYSMLTMSGQTFFISISPKMGIPSYIMPKFDFIKMLEHIQSFRITSLALAPPIAIAIAKNPAVKSYDLSSIRTIGSAAAPLAQAVAEEINALWEPGHMNLKQGWGMTETTCGVMGWHPEDVSHTQCVGELLANCSAKIMSEDGTTELPAGQRGELWVRAPNVMKGYWRNPRATAETLTPDGWLKTGDVCYVDTKGKFTVVDRTKELIKVKGNQVAPAELEAVLLEHPDVADAAVVGISWEGDERPRAYVVLKESSQGKVSPMEVKRWMDSRVARHKRLEGGVVFVDVVPKNPVSLCKPNSPLKSILTLSLLQYYHHQETGLHHFLLAGSILFHSILAHHVNKTIVS
jgi:4-coumarate--CoA ligase